MNVQSSMTARTPPHAQASISGLVETRPLAQAEPIVTTHRVTYSNRLKVFIGPDETVGNFLRPLCRLDGYHRFSVNMTRLSAPVAATDITSAISSAPGPSSVQCTGSAEALVIEVQTAVEGLARRFTAGLPGSRSGEPNVCIPDGTDFLRVYPDEVFTAEQAAEIFATYFETDDIPAGLQLREIAE
ncbi:hypothetical protein [Nocardia australiensis]|uniref:hypothetical protein n=1 Tax=Nocardia australiensis TaxID=2887191 RepID=UPI001D1441A6|nr:hypothetical protein [Nocardia australiensis]